VAEKMQMLGSRGEGGGGGPRGAGRPAASGRGGGGGDQESYEEYSTPSPAGFPDDEIPF
jgi:single-stranded DNA-binding protein